MAINLANRYANSAMRRRRLNLSSEINVTPLVDVMLVLLIIFMITSPMLVAGIDVDLPETARTPITEQDAPLVISIDKSGELYILETKIARSELAVKLLALTKDKQDKQIFIRGDKNIPYGEVIRVITDINAAGFTKVALLSSIKHNEK